MKCAASAGTLPCSGPLSSGAASMEISRCHRYGTSVSVALCTRLCMHTLRHRRLLPQLGLLLLTQPVHAASGPPPGPSDAPPSCSGCPRSGARFPVPCCRHLLRGFSETMSEAKDCMGKAVAWTLSWQAAPQSAPGQPC